jgi:hypothetical protein
MNHQEQSNPFVVVRNDAEQFRLIGKKQGSLLSVEDQKCRTKGETNSSVDGDKLSVDFGFARLALAHAIANEDCACNLRAEGDHGKNC